MEHRKVVIIGSGPAGFTAAIYAARAQLEPLLFEGFFSGPAGGQLMTTTDIENYPGFPHGLKGPELMDRMREQAKLAGTTILTEDVIEVELKKRPFVIKSKDQVVTADTIIVATGATAKRLDIEGAGDEGFWQKGVTACAICDGASPIFRNKDLYVVGGGDTAAEEALFLTRYASKVYVVHRRDELRASKVMAERVLSHPKIECLWNSVVIKVEGDDIVRALIIENVQTKEREKREAGGLFFAIGHQPNTAFLQGQVALLPNGYIEVVPGSCKTSIPGLFAAGDVQDFIYRQAVTAAGSGCMAALEAERYLAHME